MADAAIGATIQVVLERVISIASERIGLLLGFDKELECLRRYANMIQAVLADAEARQDHAVKSWLQSLEGVAFDADHLFDELNYEILRRKVKSRNLHLNGKVCFFFSFSYANIAFRSRMASKVRDIKIKLERITQEANTFGLIIRHQIEAALPASAGVATSRQTDSVVVPNIVGRDKDKSRIVEILLSPSEKSVSIIPITGMGGIGKTTLAKSVYNNTRISEQFEKKIWVCMAKKIEIMELFKLILESLTSARVEVHTRDALIQKIRQEVGGKRYFLVLDDVWNDEQGLWNDFFNTLQGLNPTNGSWCLVTTRLEQVANTVSRHLKMDVGPYMLGKLSEDECWSILKEKVIGAEEVPKELEALKKQILRRCDGVPLAAGLIGGLLLQKGKDEWQYIVDESLLNGDQNDIMQILKVSFDHLSPTLVKKCFAYCSIFPQDTKLRKDILIELWMAEGFLQSDPKSERLMEAIGDKYFSILLQSSLLLEEQWSTYTFYKMHDLVHDFAKSVLNPVGSSSEDRYLALSLFERTAENNIKTTSVRTLFLGSGISSGMLSKFEYLHVLKLSGEDVDVLPTSIGKLIHLRLLDISDSKIKIFPKSLCKLYSLQTLRIDDDILDSIQGGFPKQMSNLISLRHLHYYDWRAEFQMPLEIGRLTCLQTLKFFNVGKEKGLGIEELKSLKDLKGKLVIRNLELVNGKQGAKQAKLFEKTNLCRLKFEWGSQDGGGNNCDDDDVLEGLQPHPYLKELAIRNFMGENFPQWFIHLTTLVDLVLTNCNRCSELPALGQLPFLERLELEKLEKIKCMGLSFYGINNDKAIMPRKFFPALKYLSLRDMENLVEWKGAEEIRSATGETQVILFPVLERLSIYKCFQLKTLHGKGSSLRLDNYEMMECLCQFPSLQFLGVKLCPNLTSLRTGVCGTCLKELRVWDCENLRELPEDLYKFQALRSLDITRCPKINQLVIPAEGQKILLTSLEELSIAECDGLSSLPLEMLESSTSLRKTKVRDCPNLMTDASKEFACLSSLVELRVGPFSDYSSLNEFDWSGLISSSTLTSLQLYGSPPLESLPDQLQYLTALTQLGIHEFGIEALPDWLGNFGSLQILTLHNCKRLRCLPAKDAMTRLTKLTSLSACGCPLLRERWTNSGFSGTSHIPHLRID